MNKKRKNSVTQTSSINKRLQKVTPMRIIEKTKSQPNFDNNFINKSIIEKNFLVLEKSLPTYYQNVTGLQLEYIRFYENFFQIFVSFQKSIIDRLGMPTIQFEKIYETNSKAFENLLKINVLKFESFILSLESFRDIIREWNSLFVSYSNTYQKIFSIKNN
jgi:hypothetical protein